MLSTAYGMTLISCDSSISASGSCLSAELNKHSAILLFAWPWNQTLPLDTTAFIVTHLFHSYSSGSQKESSFVE